MKMFPNNPSKKTKGKMPNDAPPFAKSKSPKAKVKKPSTPVQGQAPAKAGPIPPAALGSMVSSLKGINK